MLTNNLQIPFGMGLNVTSYINSPNPVYSVGGIIAFAIIVAIIISIFGYIFGWLERKMIAKVQHRHGPTYVGKFGILQNFADLVKLLAKEDIIPDSAERTLYIIGLPLLVSVSIFLVLLLPFAPSLQATNFAFGILIIFVLLSFTPILLFITAFSTSNKFADISAQRSVLILLSYELPMILAVAAVGIAAHGYNIASIISAQRNGIFAIFMPLGLAVLFITMLAELERPPFDLREADSELIAGWLTDMSAPYYALSLFLDYSRMLLGSLLITILFFGGWEGPLLPPIVWLLAKASVISIFIIIIRATTVRMRIDSILKFGWKWLLPLSLINLVIAYIIFA